MPENYWRIIKDFEKGANMNGAIMAFSSYIMARKLYLK